MRRREGGIDAEGHDQAVGGGDRRFAARAFEGLHIANDVVGGKDQDRCFRIALARQRRGDGDRHGGIAAHRLEHDVGLDVAFAQLFGDDETEIGIGDDDRPLEQFDVGNAAEHLLKGRALVDQRDELLGHAFARHRPQTCARAAAHDHRYQAPPAHRPPPGNDMALPSIQALTFKPRVNPDRNADLS